MDTADTVVDEGAPNSRSLVVEPDVMLADADVLDAGLLRLLADVEVVLVGLDRDGR